VLKISPTTALNELKKASTLSNVNHRRLVVLHPGEATVVIRLAEEDEVDEMRSRSYLQVKKSRSRDMHRFLCNHRACAV
jgi:hypothetical protein